MSGEAESVGPQRGRVRVGRETERGENMSGVEAEGVTCMGREIEREEQERDIIPLLEWDVFVLLGRGTDWDKKRGRGDTWEANIGLIL